MRRGTRVVLAATALTVGPTAAAAQSVTVLYDDRPR